MSRFGTVYQHLDELRRRLIRILICLFLFALAAYIYADKVLFFLGRDVGGLIFISPAELFITRIKLALWLSFLISFPILIFEVFSYILPALIGASRRNLKYLILFSILFFYGGIIFSYKFFLPLTLDFLLNTGTDKITAMISVGRYVSFLCLFLFCFGVVALIPVMLIFCLRSDMISLELLKKKRKYLYVIAFIIAAIITPPDAITQVLFAIPIILFYEISILISSLSGYNKKK